MSDGHKEAIEEGIGGIKWRNDCQGKKDYDGHIVHVSSRYWPRGGGYFTFSTFSGEIAGNEARPEIRPSAASSIMFFEQEIARAEFEADTEEEVKALVEAWVKARVESLSDALWKWSLADDTSARDRALVEEGVSIATGGVCGLGDAESAEAVARVDARRVRQ